MSPAIRRTRGEALRFLVVGSTTVLVDFVTYVGLLALGTNISVAKALGLVVATLFAFAANRIWTFKVVHYSHGQFVRFLFAYAVASATNVGVNALGVWILGTGELGLTIAYLAATGTSATMNFLSMKFFVFATWMEPEKAPE